MRQAYIDEQNRLQAEYQALLNEQAQQAEEEARLAPLIEAVQRENEANWSNMDFGDWAKRVGAGALPIAGAVGGSALGGALGTLVTPGIGTVIGAGLGGALSGGLGSFVSTGLNSEIAKSDAYEYQKALNALKLARGEDITQTPEQAVDIARQNTGILENPKNTWTNVGFDTLGGLIGGGGLANVAGKALAGKAGSKILGLIGSRPVDYLVNATQGAMSPTLQENPLFEGDYGTEEATTPDQIVGGVAGLGLSGLGHALPSMAKGSSDFVQALTGQRLKNVDPNQMRLSQQAKTEMPDEVVQEATQKPVSMLQGLFDKINLGKRKNDYIGAYDVQKSNVVPEQNVTSEKFQLPTGIDNSEQLLRQQEMTDYINNARKLQREQILNGALDDRQFLKEQTPINIVGLVEQKLGRPISENEQIELFNNPELMKMLINDAEADLLNIDMPKGFTPSNKGLELEKQYQDIIAGGPLDIPFATTGVRKTSEDIAGYLPSRQTPLLETGISNAEQLLRQEEMANYIARSKELQRQANINQLPNDKPFVKEKTIAGLLETGKVDPRLANKQIAKSKKLAQKERIAGIPNDKQFIKSKPNEPNPMEYKAKGVKDLPKKGQFRDIEKDIAQKTKETAKKLEAFKKANAKKKGK